MDIFVWRLAFLLNYNFWEICIHFFCMGIDVLLVNPQSDASVICFCQCRVYK